MKEREFGTILYPERYSPVDNDCIISNSIEAFEFFKDGSSPNGTVFLGKLVFPIIPEKSILGWIYIDIENKEILSCLPVFLSDFEEFQDTPILSVEILGPEIFFFKNFELYSSVLTSTNEVTILKVRSLPVLDEFYQVLKLEGLYNVTDVYPVKVYNTVDNSFLATCWAFETDKDELYFKPVCEDDNENFDNINIEDTEVFPIDLGEDALIGKEHYILRYTKEKGRWFEKIFGVENRKKKAKTGKKALIVPMPNLVQKS